MRVVWTKDSHLDADFHELFQNTDLDVASEFDEQEIQPSLFDVYDLTRDTPRDVWINGDTPRHIFLRTAFVVNNTLDHSEEMDTALRILVPVMPVFRLMAPYKVINMVGVHMQALPPGGDQAQTLAENIANPRVSLDVETVRHIRAACAQTSFLEAMQNTLAEADVSSQMVPSELSNDEAAFPTEMGERELMMFGNDMPHVDGKRVSVPV